MEGVRPSECLFSLIGLMASHPSARHADLRPFLKLYCMLVPEGCQERGAACARSRFCSGTIEEREKPGKIRSSRASRCRQSQEKKRSHRVFRLGRRKIKFNPCFPGACTSENTLCSLQVCERLPQASARSRLKPLLSAKPLGFVDSLQHSRKECHFFHEAKPSSFLHCS